VLFAFGGSGYFPVADLNYDTVVDDADLLTVLFNFGNSCWRRSYPAQWNPWKCCLLKGTP